MEKDTAARSVLDSIVPDDDPLPPNPRRESQTDVRPHSIPQDAPQGRQPISPTNLLPLSVAAAGVGDRSLVEAGGAEPGQLAGELDFDAEPPLPQAGGDRGDQLAA